MCLPKGIVRGHRHAFSMLLRHTSKHKENQMSVGRNVSECARSQFGERHTHSLRMQAWEVTDVLSIRDLTGACPPPLMKCSVHGAWVAEHKAQWRQTALKSLFLLIYSLLCLLGVSKESRLALCRSAAGLLGNPVPACSPPPPCPPTRPSSHEGLGEGRPSEARVPWRLVTGIAGGMAAVSNGANAGGAWDGPLPGKNLFGLNSCSGMLWKPGEDRTAVCGEDRTPLGPRGTVP